MTIRHVARGSLVLAILVSLFALALITATPAAADLRFCNRTKSRIGVAIGYRDKEGWVTEGWFNLAPSLCETFLRGPLAARYYYFYAIDYDLGGEWGGKAFMCTQGKVFTIRGADRCSERGFERTGFIEVDTAEQKSWTVQLTEPGEKGGAAQ